MFIVFINVCSFLADFLFSVSFFKNSLGKKKYSQNFFFSFSFVFHEFMYVFPHDPIKNII
jgi:hypothetical protein